MKTILPRKPAPCLARFKRVALVVAIGFSLGNFGARLGAYNGFDTTMTASAFVEKISTANPTTFAPFPAPAGTWLRIRELAPARDEAALARERAALAELRARGFRLIALVVWDAASWAGGVRENISGEKTAAGARRLPLDLREAHARARELGKTFAGLIDVWEIGNEPDLSFLEENAETYAAHLRACRLGLRAGATEAGLPPPRVLMAPLGLPPGPYLERLLACDLASAIDGLNFHFYGHAEDFSGVYRQFQDAVKNAPASIPVEFSQRAPPFFLTEYGYGLLDAAAAATPAGRERQARWFREVGAQLDALRPEAALAFCLPPYLEHGVNEFGLWMETPSKLLQASPALTWLLEKPAGDPSGSRAWERRPPISAEDSSIVLDFVARENLVQRKSFSGYFVRGISAADERAGWGEVVLYNFSGAPVRGRLVTRFLNDGARRSVAALLPANPDADGAPEAATERRPPVSEDHLIALSPGERRIVSLRVQLTATDFHATPCEFIFESEADTVLARLTTTLWPDSSLMRAEVFDDFSHAREATDFNRANLLARPRASEEPALHRDGRWLVSDGVNVRETTTSSGEAEWNFTVEKLSAEPLRPAMAELPLPKEFVFAPGALLEFSHRVATGADEPTVGAETEQTGEAWLDVYFRTANGNLFQTWPRLRAGGEWRGYAEAAENFTMAFYGRAAPPWRFAENRPVALVFFFRPERPPATFTIRGAAITRRVAK